MKYAVAAITNLRGITSAETNIYIWNYSKVNQKLLMKISIFTKDI